MSADLLYSIGLDVTDLKTSATAAKEQVDDIKKGFKGFKDVISAGGIGIAVLGFFRDVVNHAQEAKGAIDSSTAAVKDFGDGIDYVGSKLERFGTFSLGAVVKLGYGFGDLYNIITKGWGATVDAEELMDRTAAAAAAVNENLKKSTVHAAEWARINQGLKSVDEQRADLAKQGVTTQETYNLKVDALLKLRLQEINFTGETLAQRKLHLQAEAAAVDVLKTKLQLDKEEGTVVKKNADAQLEANKAEIDAAREHLALQERRKIIQTDIAKLLGEITTGEKAHLDVSEKIKRVEELRGDLRGIAKDQSTNEVEISKLLLKGKENLSDVEKEHLKLLTGETTEVKQQAEIHTLLAKGVENLTEAEKKRLAVLTGQGSKLDDQDTTLEELNRKHAELLAQADAEWHAHGFTSDELRDQIDLVEKQIRDVNTLAGSWSGLQIAIKHTGTTYENQSTAALQGVAARLQSQIFDDELRRIYRIDISTPAGDSPTGIYLRDQLAAVQHELQLRESVKEKVSRSGEDAALREYGDDVVNRGLRDMQDTATRQLTLTDSINQKLDKLFGG
jgi:hypothetical protein